MSLREILLALVLLVAGGLVVAGAAGLSVALAKVVAGVLLAGWAWLVLGEVGE